MSESLWITPKKENRMKKMITGVVVIMVALMATTPAFAQADPSTIHIHLSRSEVRANPCTGEPIQLNVELDLKIHRNTDGNGGTHMAVNSNLHGDGLGLVTGAKYRLNSVATSHFTFTGAINQTLWQDAVLVGQGDVPNFLFQQTEHFTVNNNGEITTDFDHVFTKCLG
jgi:hypothetical protein